MAGGQKTFIFFFGLTPIQSVDFSVNDASFIGATYAEAFIMQDSNGDNDAMSHQRAGTYMRLTCGTPDGAGSIAVHAEIVDGLVTGNFSVRVVAN